jgi:hypothetical protein
MRGVIFCYLLVYANEMDFGIIRTYILFFCRVMKFMYIFLDESGQFTKHNNEEYFVVASFTVGDPIRTAKKFRSWVRSRFPAKMNTQSEIKWSATGVDEKLRLKTLRFISTLDVRIRYTFLLRSNIPYTYRNKHGLESGLLYTHIIANALEEYLPIDEKQFFVFCDHRHLKKMSGSDFRRILESRLLIQMPLDSLVQVKMVDSATNVNIQIADWIVGALAWHLEGHSLGAECFKILKNNLLGTGKELFCQETKKS